MWGIKEWGFGPDVDAMVEEVGVPRFDEVASPGVHVAVSNPTLNLLGRTKPFVSVAKVLEAARVCGASRSGAFGRMCVLWLRRWECPGSMK
jgi:hypothetical protein